MSQPQPQPQSTRPTHPHLLSATYTNSTSASQPFKHTTSLPTIIPENTASKTAYLSSLRKAVVHMQEVINRELTGRMEEDKLRERERGGNGEGVNGGSGKGKKKGGKVVIDEEKEEEMYGEEEVEEED